MPWLFAAVGMLALVGLVTPTARRRFARPRYAAAYADIVWDAPVMDRPDLTIAPAPTQPEAPVALVDPPPSKASDADATVPEVVAPVEEQGNVAAAPAATEIAEPVPAAKVEPAPADHVDPASATNLGVQLEQKGDFEGAIAAYRRADIAGDVNGSFNLGCLLAELGDLAGAIAALRRADKRGDPAAASNLGVLLERRGDLNGAVDAYRRADARGDANGSFNLGLLLATRGDRDGAQEAYRRASERGDEEVVERAGAALAELRRNGSN
jgi:tetratricopeptide (TPR) repeat protein